MKNKFFDFYIRVMVIFVLKIWSIFDEFAPVTRKIKIGYIFISFFILCSTFRILNKNLTASNEEEGGEGGVSIYLVGKNQKMRNVLNRIICTHEFFFVRFLVFEL